MVKGSPFSRNFAEIPSLPFFFENRGKPAGGIGKMDGHAFYLSLKWPGQREQIPIVN